MYHDTIHTDSLELDKDTYMFTYMSSNDPVDLNRTILDLRKDPGPPGQDVELKMTKEIFRGALHMLDTKYGYAGAVEHAYRMYMDIRSQVRERLDAEYTAEYTESRKDEDEDEDEDREETAFNTEPVHHRSRNTIKEYAERVLEALEYAERLD